MLTSFHNVHGNKRSVRAAAALHRFPALFSIAELSIPTKLFTNNGLLCFRALSCGYQIVWPKVREPWPKERKSKRAKVVHVRCYLRMCVPDDRALLR
jgi:hypothetical protein